MTPSHFCGGHSCRGLWVRGLVPCHISAHQLRNGVQIAALIPRLSLAGGSSAPSQPISIAGHRLMESEVTAAACRQQLATLQQTVYLVCACVGWGGCYKKQLLTMDSLDVCLKLSILVLTRCFFPPSDGKRLPG